MQYIIREDSIDILPLSKRAANCAHRIGAHTVGEFLDITAEEWINTRNLGQKTLDEILLLAKSIMESTGEFRLAENCTESEISILEEIKNARKYEEDTIYLDENDHIVHDAAIEDIAPSVRACNALKHAGYDYASQIIGLTEEEIANIRNVGVKTVNEIKDMVSNLKIVYMSDVPDETIKNGQQDSQIRLADELFDSFGQARGFWIRETVAARSEYPDIQGETLIYRLYERPAVHDAAQAAILVWLDEQGKMSHMALEKKMPEHCSNTTILDELLLELERHGKVTIADADVIRVYPSVMDFVPLIEDERHRKIVADRFAGKTLDEIGLDYNISRERVRQIFKKEFRFIHKNSQVSKFREDQYLPMFRKYQFFESDFSDAFDEPVSTYCYLDIIDDLKFEEKRPLEEILTDDSISLEYRRRAEKIIYKDYINDNGVRIKANRQNLVKYFVRQYCKELTEYDAFYTAYHQWLDQFEINDIDKCVLNAKSYINFLSGADFVLWNWSGKFRYYYIPERDYGELLDTLSLDQYADVVLSAAKWFQDYPEIMAQYDIRDGFELHNLLKKIEIPECYHIQFGKMPTIIFGQGSVENQLFDLIVEYAPISGDALALKYEELYGVRANVIRGGSEIQKLNAYFDNGMYRIDHPSMSSEQITRMTELLDGDYYTFDDVKRIFRREFPDADVKLLNTYSLKTLGFHVFSGGVGYLIRNTYQNATKYFHTLMTRDDVFDLGLLPGSIRNSQTFTAELYDLRHNFDIIEFVSMQYINIRRLEKLDVSKQSLVDYCEAAAARIEIGEYFTVKSLREDGFVHPLDDLGFEEWFYSSVLAENENLFSYTRLGGTRLFLKDKCKKQYACSFVGLLCNILESYRKFDFYELSDYLTERYGINVPKEKLKEAIHESDLYYDPIMEAVYIDYDTYFEEI